jgi:hypothetical protein
MRPGEARAGLPEAPSQPRFAGGRANHNGQDLQGGLSPVPAIQGVKTRQNLLGPVPGKAG